MLESLAIRSSSILRFDPNFTNSQVGKGLNAIQIGCRSATAKLRA